MTFHKNGVPMPKTCIECEAPLRRGKPEPGDTESRWYGGKGMCANCYKISKLAAGEPQPQTAHARDISPAEHAANINGLAAFIRARRNRGVPPEGTIPDPTVIHAALELEPTKAA